MYVSNSALLTLLIPMARFPVDINRENGEALDTLKCNGTNWIALSMLTDVLTPLQPAI